MKQNEVPSQVDFTENARESFYSAVDDPYFRDRDYSLIYDALRNQLRLVPFGDFLKRYIYHKADLQGNYRDIPLNEYLSIIRDSFLDHETPPSFTPTTARFTALAKNWLTQQSVKRSVVLLLGFGLGMPLEDVNTFLTKALREQVLNPKDPMEVICWYCYRNHLGYPKFESLWKRFQELPMESDVVDAIFDEHTVGIRDKLYGISDEEALMLYLKRLRLPYNRARQSVAAREAFDKLYVKAQRVAAGILNETEAAERSLHAQRERERLANSDRLFDYEKNSRVIKQLQPKNTVLPEEVTPTDIEKIICSAIPIGTHGNLIPAKASELNEQFSGKRFSRQHISDVLAGKSGIDRFDLLTLNFFLFAGDNAAYIHTQRRYSSFIESMNHILDRCGMGRVYIANPYECFILMCLLSDDPLGTYADVLEISYQAAEKQ